MPSPSTAKKTPESSKKLASTSCLASSTSIPNKHTSSTNSCKTPTTHALRVPNSSSPSNTSSSFTMGNAISRSPTQRPKTKTVQMGNSAISMPSQPLDYRRRRPMQRSENSASASSPSSNTLAHHTSTIRTAISKSKITSFHGSSTTI